MGFVFKEKLKRLKGVLRKWNKEVYGNVDSKIADLMEGIEVLDLKGESDGLSEVELLLRKTKFSQLWLLLKSKDSLEFQRSRSRWLKEGDANTGFFHACVKSRKRSNTLMALRSGRFWLSHPEDIRREVVTYFHNHFQEVTWERPKLDGIEFKHLTVVEARGLEGRFLREEVVEVISLSDGNKSPGPDGFNFSFFKKFWGILEMEVLRLFDEFHLSASLPSCFSSYFITLIPKITCPHLLSDFRPISLLGSLYKLLAKVLARRLGNVMDVVISKNQSGFLEREEPYGWGSGDQRGGRFGRPVKERMPYFQSRF
jgi:hypothetical protein